MRRIVYASFATKPFSVRELFDLLEQARKANELRDVTGVLFYQDRFFMQCLEGPTTEVSSLLDRIIRDPRHEAFTILSDQPMVAHRLFTSWAMGFFHMAAVEAIAPAGLIANGDTFEAAIGTDSGNDAAALILRQYWKANVRKLDRNSKPTPRLAL